MEGKNSTKNYIQAYKNEHYKRICILIRKDDSLIERLERYESATKQSKNSIIQDALREYLYKRGY